QGHTAHLGILHGNESLYLIKERPARPETLVTDVGVRLPAQLTASGRCMLARLPRAQVRALFPGSRDFVKRTARGPRHLADLDRQGRPAHLGILHGNESLYLIKERPARPETLVTDVGVRLPAQLTASGRCMLARLPRAQVRALFPGSRDFVKRTARGPRHLADLRRLLDHERRQGWSVEDGFVTPGFASVAYPVLDHSAHP